MPNRSDEAPIEKAWTGFTETIFGKRPEGALGIAGTLLAVVGGGWALIGMGNLVMMFAGDTSATANMFGMILNMVLFILPGMGIAGLGYFMIHRD